MRRIVASLSFLLFLSGSGECQATGHILFYAFVDNNADIYSIAPDGSHLTHLTDHPELDWFPDCSPDGKKIVFASARDQQGPHRVSTGIFVMEADGSNPTFLTAGQGHAYEPRWSPDGTKIAYVSESLLSGNSESADIMVMNSDGTSSMNLTNNGGTTYDVGPQWSPSGKKIAFDSSPWQTVAGIEDSMSVGVIDVNGANWIRVTGKGSTSGLGSSAWSPSGEQLVLGVNGDICLMNEDGSKLTNLTNTPDRVERSPAWSPDGSQILFEVDDGSIWLMNTGGTQVTNLTSGQGSSYHPDPMSGLTEGYPIWSLDGSQIIIAKNYDIQLMNSDGTGLRSLVSGQSPSWCLVSDQTPVAPITWGLVKQQQKTNSHP